MKFVIITHVKHKRYQGQIYAYGPYVREMNIWLKHTGNPVVIAPIYDEKPSPIDIPYTKKVEFHPVPAFSLISPLEILKTLRKLPLISWKVFKTMKKADHIHLRLPGNMGLIGSFLQIFFPKKPKTAKYAGNWDPDAPQPWSYRLQKFLVSRPWLTKKMKVLAYGEWPGQNKNIVPFFTASYKKEEIVEVPPRKLKEPVKLLYAGALSAGKRPLLTVQAAQELLSRGIQVKLDMYGDGNMRNELKTYINQHTALKNNITLHGNKPADILKKAYQNSMFLIFASKSEGWPKVVAEAMLWKCLPVTTKVSAVPYILGYGERGSLVKPEAPSIADEIEMYLKNPDIYQKKADDAYQWAQQFTLEKFEEEIIKFL